MAEIVLSAQALADLGRLEAFARGALELTMNGIELLARHPLVGRLAEEGLRELVVSRGESGYVVLYRWDESNDEVRVLAIRHQREVWSE